MRTLILMLLLSHSLAALAGTPINESRPSSSTAKIRFNSIEGELKVVIGSNDRWELSGELADGVKNVDIHGNEQSWTIELKYEERRRSYNGGTQLTLSVPQQASIDVQVVSANLEVAELEGDRVELHTVSGDITSRASPQRLELQTVSGDIELSAGGQQYSLLESVSGDIRIQDLSGELEAQSVSGEIDVQQARLSRAELESVSGDLTLNVDLDAKGSIKASSHSGDVDVRMPGNLGMDIQIETFSGDIRSDWGNVIRPRHGPGSRLQHSEGNGSAHIELNSFSGDIELHGRR